MTKLADGKLLAINCDDLPWKASTFAKGLSVKDVAVVGDLEMQLVRFEPGTQLPLHKHELPEFIYVLEGELVIAGQHMTRGWANIASPGSVHADVHSDTGCTFVLVDKPL